MSVIQYERAQQGTSRLYDSHTLYNANVKYDAETSAFGQSTISGDEFCCIWPVADRRNGIARPIIWCHSASYYVDDLLTPQDSMAEVFRALAAAGYTVLMPMHGSAASFPNPEGGGWGNDTARTKLSTAKTWLQQTGYNKGGAKSGSIVLMGGSMGAVTAWSYCKYLGYSNIRGITLTAPVLNMSWARGTDSSHTPTTTNLGGSFYTSINRSYGGNGGDPDSTFDDTAWNAIKSVRDPYEIMRQTGFKNIPTLLHYCADDLIIGANADGVNKVTEAVADLTNCTIHVSATGGHTNQLQPEIYVEWLNRLDWS